MPVANRPTFAHVVVGDGVAFSGGVMQVNGVRQVPIEVQKWMSSNEITEYTTIMWKEPNSNVRRCSCNCPGWTMKKTGQNRSCAHSDDMMGIKKCNKRRVTAEPTAIRTVNDALRNIPKLQVEELPERALRLED